MPAIADETILNGNVSFDWATKSQLERDENIAQIKKLIYKDDLVTKYPKKDFRAQHAEFLKDKDRDRHYIEISEGIKENQNERLAGFYFKGEKIMYMYGIQYKNDKNTIYYYDMFGNLRYVDKFSENYPNFPYYTLKYKANGELTSTSYFTAENVQYMYKNGKFIGIWFNDTMFNSKAKKIMTRTNY